MPNKKNILVTILNWGIGHATRSIPMIQSLQKMHNVIIASDGLALQYLKNNIADVFFEELPSYGISYAPGASQKWHLAKQIPQIVRAIKSEHLMTQMLTNKYQIDIIISDNRYGTYHHNIPNIIITHQLQLQLGFGSEMVNYQLRKWLKKFDEIWIPDEPNHLLSGRLSTSRKLNRTFIGPQSRMYQTKATPPKPPFQNSFVLAVISGPEPQRAIFEGILIRSFIALQTHVIIVGGAENQKPHHINGNVTYIAQLNGAELKWYMEHANQIICRSGYSTLMDLIALKRTALLIPTPGQPEQEYLAHHFTKTLGFSTISQDQLHLVSVSKYLNSSSTEGENSIKPSTFNFTQAIDNILA